MELKTIVEKLEQSTEGNVIFKLKNNFYKGSVEAYVEGVEVELKEMGVDHIRLLTAPFLGSIVNISYKVQVSTSQPDMDIVREIRSLKTRCEELEKQNQLLLEALDAKVPAKTFRQWLLVMEKNFGKTILDKSSLLGIQGESIPND